jgi:hypothetical protein
MIFGPRGPIPCRVRLRRLLALVVALPVMAGCSGADASRAQLLLKQAQDAQVTVSSESFSAHLNVEAQGRKTQLVLNGGSYLKGARAGDMMMNIRMSASSAAPFQTMRIAKIGTRAWMEMNGRRIDFPAAAVSPTRSSPLGGFDVTRYVKDVKVQGGHVLNGKPVTKIVGTLDTPSLLAGMAKLGNFAGSAGLPDLGGKISDTRVVIFVDDATHLLVAALADLSLNSDAGTVKMHLDLAISGVDRPVAALPSS